MLHVSQAREQTGQSNTGSEESFVTPVLSQEVSEEIYSDICAFNYQTQVENSLSETMPRYTSISNASEISEALNSFSVTGEDINRHDITAKELQKCLTIHVYLKLTVIHLIQMTLKMNKILLFLFQISAKTLSIFYETSSTWMKRKTWSKRWILFYWNLSEQFFSDETVYLKCFKLVKILNSNRLIKISLQILSNPNSLSSCIAAFQIRLGTQLEVFSSFLFNLLHYSASICLV